METWKILGLSSIPTITFGKQHTLILYVYDVMYSHVNPTVDDKFKEWMNRNYGKHGKLKANIE